MAVSYLACPATSVPSECIFSKSGYITKDRRSSLSPDHINEILFVHQNCKSRRGVYTAAGPEIAFGGDNDSSAESDIESDIDDE